MSRVSAKVTSCVINNLQANCTYYIRVAAENEEGVGKFREITEPVRPMKPKSEYMTLLTNKTKLMFMSCTINLCILLKLTIGAGTISVVALIDKWNNTIDIDAVLANLAFRQLLFYIYRAI